jgi:peptide/nickel transport system permease protein
MGFWEMFYKNKLTLAGSGIVVLLFVVSILAPVISPYDPGAIDLQNVLV